MKRATLTATYTHLRPASEFQFDPARVAELANRLALKHPAEAIALVAILEEVRRCPGPQTWQLAIARIEDPQLRARLERAWLIAVGNQDTPRQ